MTEARSEASKLLEAALEQMDGIIRGAKFDVQQPEIDPEEVSEALRSAERRLRAMKGESQRVRVPTETRVFLRGFLEDEEERRRMSALKRQIERQADRITTLEGLLLRKTTELSRFNGSLTDELSELERVKREYRTSRAEMAEKIARLERENEQLRRRKDFSESSEDKAASSSSPESNDDSSKRMDESMDRSLPPKGLKKILGKMKRSNSGSHLNASSPSPEIRQSFRRGGSRATIGGVRSTSVVNASLLLARKPFMEWNVDCLCLWMETLGLSAYNNEIRKSIADAKNFSSLNISEYETKFGMKNPLHRKKVYLALNARVHASKNDSQGDLDPQWILRWLDDVGLPQYKEVFLDCRIDGRVLNMLTTEDLFHMKIHNQLHHLSLKRGIQALRAADFRPDCMTRRAVDDDENVGTWSNYRIMEWLREVDLSEYSPNLRGSGVHGGLFLYEPRFNDELLASLLSIPSVKTLLRRHLSIRFKELVGPAVMREKRLSQSEFQPLTPTAKAKFANRNVSGQFSLRRKKSKSLFDYDDLLCPYTKCNKN